MYFENSLLWKLLNLQLQYLTSLMFNMWESSRCSFRDHLWEENCMLFSDLFEYQPFFFTVKSAVITAVFELHRQSSLDSEESNWKWHSCWENNLYFRSLLFCWPKGGSIHWCLTQWSHHSQWNKHLWDCHWTWQGFISWSSTVNKWVHAFTSLFTLSTTSVI